MRPHVRFDDLPGAALDIELSSWLERRSYRADEFSLERLLEAKRATVSVILPARNVAGTIADVVDALLPLQRRGLVDELVVVDAASADGTARIARERGATVRQESELLPEFGPALGKGDAMWRGLSATSGDVVVYLDTDTEGFTNHLLLGLLGPVLTELEVQLVKGSFRRPLRVGDALIPDGGGRVTELLARPFLNLFVPELAGFRQPLAGEIAARRDLLESIRFPVGYGVEIAMLIDALELLGLDALAQVDLETRQNRHQPLPNLSAMAYGVLTAAARRVHDTDAEKAFGAGTIALPMPDGLELRRVPVEERPPLRSLRRDPARPRDALRRDVR